MKKITSVFIVLFIISISVFSQTVVRSLDIASPSFCEEEKNKLLLNGGYYFERTLYSDTSISGTVYQGTGFVSGSTRINEAYLFYIGGREVDARTFFRGIGLEDYFIEYDKYLKKRQKHSAVMWPLAILGGISLGAGLGDLLTSYEGDYILGSQEVVIGITVSGVVMAGIALWQEYKYNNEIAPSPPSPEYIAALANEKNRNILLRMQ